MKEWLSTLLDAALLRTEAIARFRDRRDVFFQGFLVVVAVALLVGLPVFVGGLVKAVQPRPAEAELEQANAQIQAVLAQIQPYLRSMPPGTQQQLDQILGIIKTWIGAGIEIANLPTLLPKPIGGLLQAFGAWLSLPFAEGSFPLAATLTIWLGYGVWVMLLAKLLGGRGTLAGFLGTSALYAVPHALSIFALVPCLGSILGLVAVVWGLIIYIKATAVSHELTVGRALVAVLVPALALILVVILGSAIVGALVASAISNAARP